MIDLGHGSSIRDQMYLAWIVRLSACLLRAYYKEYVMFHLFDSNEQKSR